MLEMTLREYLDQSQIVPAFADTEESRRKYLSRSTFWLHLGIFLIVLGFFLQVFASPTVYALAKPYLPKIL